MKRSFTPFTGKSYSLNSPKYSKKASISLPQSDYQIFIKTTNGKTKTLKVTSSTTILEVKIMLEKKIQSPVGKQRLIFGGSDLQDKYSLRQYGIRKQSTLELLLRLVGGNCLPTVFNSMDKPLVQKFADTAPDWRKVCQGLTLEGICMNVECKAFKKKVLAVKNFGTFNMNKETKICKCPMCSQKIINVQNMTLYKAKMKIVGQVQGQDKQIQKEYIHEEDGTSLTFEDKDVTRANWAYLELTVTKL